MSIEHSEYGRGILRDLSGYRGESSDFHSVDMTTASFKYAENATLHTTSLSPSHHKDSVVIEVEAMELLVEHGDAAMMHTRTLERIATEETLMTFRQKACQFAKDHKRALIGVSALAAVAGAGFFAYTQYNGSGNPNATNENDNGHLPSNITASSTNSSSEASTPSSSTTLTTPTSVSFTEQVTTPSVNDRIVKMLSNPEAFNRLEESGYPVCEALEFAKLAEYPYCCARDSYLPTGLKPRTLPTGWNIHRNLTQSVANELGGRFNNSTGLMQTEEGFVCNTGR